MAARLKVYQASLDGLNDWIVAAPNQRAALNAWGVRQNLFQEGQARIAADQDSLAPALAEPGVIFRRPRGSHGVFTPFAQADVQGWSAAAKAVGAKARPRKKAADRSALTAAERALEAFERDSGLRLNALADRRADLEREVAAVQRDIAVRRDEMRAALDEAERDFRIASR